MTYYEIIAFSSYLSLQHSHFPMLNSVDWPYYRISKDKQTPFKFCTHPKINGPQVKVEMCGCFLVRLLTESMICLILFTCYLLKVYLPFYHTISTLIKLSAVMIVEHNQSEASLSINNLKHHYLGKAHRKWYS